MKDLNLNSKRLVLASLLVIAVPMAAVAKPATQASDSWRAQVPPAGRPIPPVGQRNAQRPEKAEREISKAREEALSVQVLARQASSSAAREATSVAQQILQQAQSSYSAGRFFAAEKEAKAAKSLYEAAETLYEGELGYVTSSSGRPKPPSRSYSEAPFKAQERIARAEAEMNYYRANDSRVANLINRAKQLAGSSTQVASVQNPNSVDFAYLTSNRAAEHYARAALHLMEAQRGF